MTKTYYSFYEFQEATNGTAEQYYAQFNTARVLEVGATYVVNPGQWDEKRVTILWIGDGVAVGREVTDFSKSHGLYSAQGLDAGWRYNDNRAEYRLQPMKERPTHA